MQATTDVNGDYALASPNASYVLRYSRQVFGISAVQFNTGKAMTAPFGAYLYVVRQWRR